MKIFRLFFLLVVAAGVTLAGSYAFAETKTYAEKMAKEKFEAIDTDDNGKISKDEYMAKCGQRFDGLDVDKDGYLTKEEFQEKAAKARESFREKMRRRRSGAQ